LLVARIPAWSTSAGAAAIDPHINILFGGLHQIQKPDPRWSALLPCFTTVQAGTRGPGHCTGEPEFAALKRAFGDHYVYAAWISG